MSKGSVLVTYAALAAAEFVRGVGLIASGALTYGLLGGSLPAEGGYDRLVAYASFATIALGALDLLLLGLIALRSTTGNRPLRAQVLVSVGLSVLLILAGGPLAPQVAMLGLSTLLSLAIRQGGATGAAKELGDLRENADYEIARNEQSFIEGKILEIEEKLRNAEIIDENASTDEVALGSTVTVTAERKSRDYLIVGSTEADPSGEPPKISNESPLGKALIGRKVGDKVVVTLPNGNEINYTIKKIS